MKLDPYHTLLTKINLNCIKTLYITLDKTPRGKHRKLLDNTTGNIFFNMTPKAQAMKVKINK